MAVYTIYEGFTLKENTIPEDQWQNIENVLHRNVDGINSVRGLIKRWADDNHATSMERTGLYAENKQDIETEKEREEDGIIKIAIKYVRAERQFY